jgi:hypothetical protein
LVDVLLGLSQPDIQALRAQLRPVPQPVQLRALIDSGAEVTSLDQKIIKALALPLSNVTLANLPATVGMLISTFHTASVTILHPSGVARQHHYTPKLSVCDLPLGLLGYDAVIGRDILNRLRFVYDGPPQKFSLDY